MYCYGDILLNGYRTLSNLFSQFSVAILANALLLTGVLADGRVEAVGRLAQLHAESAEFGALWAEIA